MRVNLRVGFFGSKVYEVRAEADALRFEGVEEGFEIPCASIRRVTLRGEAGSTDGFSLETDAETYRGHFDSADDARRFLDAVGERMKGKLAIDLTRL